MDIYHQIYFDQLRDVAIHNKYTSWYIKLCQKATLRGNNRKQIIQNIGYVESHHIIPRSFNLINAQIKDNQIYLTPREHFIAHRFLMKMFSNIRYKKLMTKAVFLMGSNTKYIISSKMYEYIRLEYAKTNKRTDEEKKNLARITNRRKWVIKEETDQCLRVDIDDLDKYLVIGFKLGRRTYKIKTPRTAEWRRDASIRQTGKKYPVEVGIKRGMTRKLNNKPMKPLTELQLDRLRKMAGNRKGKINSEEHNKKISKSLKTK